MATVKQGWEVNKMRLLVETDDKALIEVREIENVPPDADMLIFFTACVMREQDLVSLKNQLIEKTGKRCVVVDSRIQKVIGA